MSAESNAPEASLADPPAEPVGPAFSDLLPPLPAHGEYVHTIHYSQERIESSTVQTPPVSAVAVQHVLTQEQHTFAAFRIAEQRGIAPSQFLARLPELEKQLLKDFY